MTYIRLKYSTSPHKLNKSCMCFLVVPFCEPACSLSILILLITYTLAFPSEFPSITKSVSFQALFVFVSLRHHYNIHSYEPKRTLVSKDQRLTCYSASSLLCTTGELPHKPMDLFSCNSCFDSLLLENDSTEQPPKCPKYRCSPFIKSLR